MRMVDESNIGIWMWVILILAINAMWISMDLWLHAHGHEYLTTEFREGLRNRYWAPVLVAGLVLTIGVFIYHFFVFTKP